MEERHPAAQREESTMHVALTAPAREATGIGVDAAAAADALAVGRLNGHPAVINFHDGDWQDAVIVGMIGDTVLGRHWPRNGDTAPVVSAWPVSTIDEVWVRAKPIAWPWRKG
jgi:hypothetical protein